MVRTVVDFANCLTKDKMKMVMVWCGWCFFEIAGEGVPPLLRFFYCSQLHRLSAAAFRRGILEVNFISNQLHEAPLH